MNVQLSPYSTSNTTGTFRIQSDQLVQGVAFDEPAIRNSLVNGVLASTETLPMWGGLPLSEALSIDNGALGGSLIRATTNATITGWSVFNQAAAFVNTPASPVPTAGNGQTIPLFRAGSKARITLPIDPALNLATDLINQQVSWDFTNNRIIAYDAAIGALAVKIINVNTGTAKTVVWDNVNKLATWSNVGSLAICEV